MGRPRQEAQPQGRVITSADSSTGPGPSRNRRAARNRPAVRRSNRRAARPRHSPAAARHRQRYHRHHRMRAAARDTRHMAFAVLTLAILGLAILPLVVLTLTRVGILVGSPAVIVEILLVAAAQPAHIGRLLRRSRRAGFARSARNHHAEIARDRVTFLAVPGHLAPAGIAFADFDLGAFRHQADRLAFRARRLAQIGFGGQRDRLGGRGCAHGGKQCGTQHQAGQRHGRPRLVRRGFGRRTATFSCPVSRPKSERQPNGLFTAIVFQSIEVTANR